nr:hypothetical protein [Eubacterium sp.]
MLPLANYLYALAYSGVYNEKEWKSWAEQLLTDVEYDADTEWVYEVAFAHDRAALFQVISKQKLSENYGPSEQYPLTEIIHGYYYLQYKNKTMTLYEMLEKSGNVADAGNDSAIGCAFFYGFLNQIDEDSRIVNNKRFKKEISEYFRPRYKAAMEQKEKLEVATVENMKFEIIRNAVEEFVDKVICERQYPNGEIEVLRDEADCYQVGVEFENCIGEIMVNRPYFAPYRFVSMEILSSDQVTAEQVFVWLDDEGDSVEEVIYQIKNGLKSAASYK